MKLPVEVFGITVGYADRNFVVKQSLDNLNETQEELADLLWTRIGAFHDIDRSVMIESNIIRLCRKLDDDLNKHNMLLLKIAEYETPF